MSPKKRPSAADEDVATDTRRRARRVGFKDVSRLATCLAPYVKERFFTTYTTDRAVKQTDKKKLTSQPAVNV